MKLQSLRRAFRPLFFLLFCAFACVPSLPIRASAAGNALITDVTTDKSRYTPGGTVSVSVRMQNETGYDIRGGAVQVAAYHLFRQTGSISSKTFSLAKDGVATITLSWKARNLDYQGYTLLVKAIDSGGRELDSCTVAVDVSSSWAKFPRYGYLWDFSTSADTAGKIGSLNSYHINALQYYDWQYLHQQPVADDLTGWKNWAGTYISGNTIRNYIGEAKFRNMVNMAYNMIYAVTGTFDAQKRQEWGLYFKQGDKQGQPFTFNMGSPATDNNVLYFMNPLNPEWQSYLFSQENNVFRTFNFDGWHADSIGEWGPMTTQSGGALDGKSIYLVKDTYTQFLNSAKAAIGGKYLVFNPVGAQGIENVNHSKVDVLYAEIWPWDTDRHGDTFSTYSTMKRLIEDSRKDSGGKSLVVAAYINYNETGGALNTATALLADATAYAAGGSRLELGNGDFMLSHEYFPDDQKLCMSADLMARERKLYDFIVAYENLLRDGETETSNSVVVSGYPSGTDGGSNTIWYFTKKQGPYDILHLINLIGTDNQWRDENNVKQTPEKCVNISVKYYTNDAVNSIWLASPDEPECLSTSLAFARGRDIGGSYLSFTVPSLEYWDMIYLSSSPVPAGTSIVTHSQIPAGLARPSSSLFSTGTQSSTKESRSSSMSVIPQQNSLTKTTSLANTGAGKSSWPYFVILSLLAIEGLIATGVWYFRSCIHGRKSDKTGME